MASIFPTRTSILAVDLTCSGAPSLLQRERDPQTETFITARLAGLAKLLDRAGTDLIAIGRDFRLGGKKRRDEFLDAALALSRLGEHTSTARLAASIPVSLTTPRIIASAVATINKATGDRGGWQVDAPTPEPARVVENVVTGLGGTTSPSCVVVNVRNDVDVEIAAARADVARLRARTVEEARTLRSAIRSAAADWGRAPEDISVLVDVRVVLADDAQSAEDRALFIEDVTHVDTEGLLQHNGTVTTLANVWQNWVRAGAADGFTIIPASIPTDVVAVATGLVPELDRRGLRTKAHEVPVTVSTAHARRQRVAA